jgi:hypothetical protein
MLSVSGANNLEGGWFSLLQLFLNEAGVLLLCDDLRFDPLAVREVKKNLKGHLFDRC